MQPNQKKTMDSINNKKMNMKNESLAQFVWQLGKGRWMVVVVSLYILFFSGATYIFGIYSGAIKSALHYNQQTIDTLSFFKDLGANVGIVSGLINEVAPPWVVLAIGAGMNVFGYLMIWMAVTHRMGPPTPGQMYLYICIGANSQTFANTGVLVNCVKNFPQSRGVVLGLVKGCVGLSGAIFTQIYHAIYGQDTRGIILLIGVLPTAITLLFMFLIRPTTPVMDKAHDKYFFSFLYLALLLAAFLMLIIIIENVFPVSAVVYKAMGAVTLLLVAANVLVAVQAEKDVSAALHLKTPLVLNPPQPLSRSGSGSAGHRHRLEEGAGVELLLLDTSSSNQPPQGGVVSSRSESEECKEGDKEKEGGPSTIVVRFEDNNDNGVMSKAMSNEHHDHDHDHDHGNRDGANIIHIPTKHSTCAHFTSRVRSFFSAKTWPERGDDFTIPQAILSLDMWILFVSITCGIGATLTAIDNMGQIGASLGYSTVSISTCVSLISIWNFLGRVIAGFLSEYLLQRYRFPRTLGLTIVMAVACVGHIMIAFPGPGTLYIASVVIGLCFGAQWPLLYAIVSELFGLKYYATLYNVGGIASPLGSYLLNVKVAGYLYDKEAKRQTDALLLSGSSTMVTELVCNGWQCFRMTFLIMTIVSAAGSFISVFLVMRTKRFYAQDIYAKFITLHANPQTNHATTT